MGFQGPPAVDFYGMLSGLGDTIAKKREQSAIAGAFQPGPDGTVDYNKALTTVAQYNPALAVSMRNHLDAQKQQEVENARAATNDKFSHGIQSASLGLQQQAAKRAQYEFDNTPDQYVANPKAGQPGEPQYIDQYAAASAANANTKPIPFETLGGTKFLVRQPDGSYSKVDPNEVGSPQPQPAAGGAFGGMASKPMGWDSASPQVASAPQAPQAPVQVADAQPANFASRFQGQTAPQSVAQQPAAPTDLTAVDPTTGRREAWLKSQPSDVQAYIKKIADYEIDPRTTSIKGGHREQVLSAVAQYDPTYDQNTFGSRSKAIKDFSTGTQGNAIRSFDVATDHLETLKKYVVALDSGNIPAINALRNAYLQETGSALPTNVQAVGPIVGAEVSKAIIGSNNALADREELRKPLLGRGAPDQILGSIQAYQDLMTGQLRGLKKQYEDTTGKKNFDSRIRDNTRKILLGGEGSGADTSSSQPNVTSTGIKWSVQ